ncbi:MAG: hypothetical protein Q9159_007264 [Coniocarpon cinnabarinum]
MAELIRTAVDALSAEAFAILSLISMFDRAPIPKYLLLPVFIAPLGIEAYPRSIASYQVHFEELRDSSLVTSFGEDFVLGHELAQQLTRAKLLRVTGLTARVFKDALSRLCSHWNYIERSYVFGTSGRIDRWEKCEQLYPHVLKLSSLAYEIDEAGDPAVFCVSLAKLITEVAG